MGLTGIQIFKLLPKTNCGECGVPTCLAFAMNLAAGKAELDKCPPVDSFEHRSCRLAALAHNPDTFPPDFWTAEELILSHPKWKALYARQEATAAQRAGQTDTYR